MTDLYNSWKGYTIACPNTKGKPKLLLAGDRGSMKSKHIQMNIRMCQKENNPNCKDKPDIIKFVKDIQLDTWAIFEKIDFAKFGHRPTFHVQEVLYS